MILDRTATTKMKAIAIMLVVISHVYAVLFGRLFFVCPAGALGVSTFLILSGYGLMESFKQHGLDGFWRKRLSRVLVPYLIFLLVYCAYRMVVNGEFPIFNLRYWFVEYIVIWYVLFYFIMKYCQKCRWLLLSIAAIAIFLLMPCLQAQQSLSFMAGILISEKKDVVASISRKRLKLIAVSCVLISFLAFFVAQWVAASRGNLDPISMQLLHAVKYVADDDMLLKFIQILTKLPLGLFVIIVMTLLDHVKMPLLEPVGRISYEIYLVQDPIYPQISGCNWSVVAFFFALAIVSYSLHVATKKVCKWLRL